MNLRSCVSALLATSVTLTVTALPQRDDGLLACGEAFYAVDKVRTSSFVASFHTVRVYADEY